MHRKGAVLCEKGLKMNKNEISDSTCWQVGENNLEKMSDFLTPSLSEKVRKIKGFGGFKPAPKNDSKEVRPFSHPHIRGKIRAHFGLI